MAAAVSSSDSWAIRIAGLGKHYQLGARREPGENLRETLMGSMRGLLRGGGGDGGDGFWALRDINLEVKRGESVGVIGRNGAGKSTLLKILSRITNPTEGDVQFRGRMASLLEVGTGFHRELTGRENIFLNGSILGMRRAEIARQFDAIVEFSGIDKFIDTAVKFYSSGMYVRLAFAVAAHLRTDILIVDEVLAVGDAEFQKKCLGKMQDITTDGRTVLFVSHNLQAIQRLCGRGVLLKGGRVDQDGATRDVLDAYIASGAATAEGSTDLRSHGGRPSSLSPFFTSLEVRPLGGGGKYPRMGEGVELEIGFESQRPRKDLKIGVVISDLLGQRLVSLSPTQQAPTLLREAPDSGTIICRVPGMNLMANRYSITLFASDAQGEVDRVEDAAHIDVLPEDVFKTGEIPASHHGMMYLPAAWESSWGEGHTLKETGSAP
ncbi:hypothetical protein BH09SUM1_BH09SUM1_11370 [soil metagenome]